MKKVIAITIFLLISSNLKAEDANVAQGAASYLDLGVGAKAAAMGNAYVSIADDPTAVYWNAACLPYLKSHQVALMSSISNIGRKFNYVGYVFGLENQFSLFNRKKGIGIGWINYGVDDIQGRDTYGNCTKKFSDSENTFIISYGQEFVENYCVGLGLKYLTHELTDYGSARGVGLDFGALCNYSDFVFGMNLQNIMRKYEWEVNDPVLEHKFKYKEDILFNAKLGVSRIFLDDMLLLSFDIDKTDKQKIRLHFGGDYEIIENFHVRIGYDELKITAGFGWIKYIFNSKILNLDYGFVFERFGFDIVHRFSLGMKFGRQGPKKKKIYFLRGLIK
ncbi:PorV/PorQ family protein [Elusimicrobiota bacterium]